MSQQTTTAIIPIPCRQLPAPRQVVDLPPVNDADPPHVNNVDSLAQHPQPSCPKYNSDIDDALATVLAHA
ncbi:hypothetical protein HGRIS_001485 [Hohenbuehelia grisea]|uniref:Uncharacterized protein n=1 Tax=Hohenbuehelia grisea TaxID=104357 RepID=A0ABR3JQI3_9AGAR